MEKRNVCDSYCGTVCTTGAVGCFYFFLAHVKSWFAFRKLDFNDEIYERLKEENLF